MALLFSAAPAQADAVEDWSRIALQAAESEGLPPHETAHSLGTVHAAMFEALVQLGGPEMVAYKPQYTLPLAVNWGTVSQQAVMAVAAHQVLLQSFPRQTARLNAGLLISMSGIGEKKRAQQMSAAVVMARSMANIVLALRGLQPNSSSTKLNAGRQAQGATAPSPTASQAWLNQMAASNGLGFCRPDLQPPGHSLCQTTPSH